MNDCHPLKRKYRWYQFRFWMPVAFGLLVLSGCGPSSQQDPAINALKPGNFDALLVALVGVNEHDFLNETLAFFRIESTTADTLMPPNVPVATLIGPPSLTTLAQ